MNTARTAGVLLPIFSLPGPFNIGCFGSEAVDFARSLRRMGFSYWQILPINPPAAGDSPYQCYSAFAGNPLMIDLRQLVADGLLSVHDLGTIAPPESAHRCDYKAAAATHRRLLRVAYANCPADRVAVIKDTVCREHPEVMDFALFTAIRETFGEVCWAEWPDKDLRDHNVLALLQFESEHADAVNYQLFCQYWFFYQWFALRATINALGVSIMGDLPIYVGYDSSDVWAHPEQFELDENRQPIEVSGVPPDYFTEDGQLWGNPLFNWDKMAADGFTWWKARIRASFELFDIMRLDHFRGFVDYWAVPFGEKTARNGRWRPGPRMKLLAAFKEACPLAVLVAEDLGASDDGAVAAFLEQSGLPGMRIMQFGFAEGGEIHLPHNYTPNCIVYTGTHDNDTLFGWIWETKAAYREYCLEYAGFDLNDDWGQGGPKSRVIRAMLRVIWQSAANMLVVPVQDMLGYGNDTRMNIPGQASGQWRWRATAEDLASIDQEAFSRLNRIYRRENQLASADFLALVTEL